MESVGRINILVIRTGNVKVDCSVDYKTVDGSAKARGHTLCHTRHTLSHTRATRATHTLTHAPHTLSHTRHTAVSSVEMHARRGRLHTDGSAAALARV